MLLKDLLMQNTLLRTLILILRFFFPKTPAMRTSMPLRQQLRCLYQNPLIRALVIGQFFLYALLVMTLCALPPLMQGQGRLYVLALIPGLLIMIVLRLIAQLFNQKLRIMTLAILMIAVAEIFLMPHQLNIRALFICILLFFSAVLTLMGLLPNWMRQIVAPELARTALWLGRFMQGLGAFCGGMFSLIISFESGGFSLFVYAVTLAALWFLYTIRLLP